MLLPENDAKPAKSLKDFYLPCSLHPNAGVKRSVQPNRDSKGVGFVSYEATCIECGRILDKKPKR